MTAGKPIFSLLLLLVIGGIAGVAWWYNHGNEAPADILVLHGNIDIRQVKVAFNASGRIEQILVHEGDHVSQGQVLARLDTRRLRRVVAEAESRVAAQHQVVDRMEAGSRPEEIHKAGADVEAAQADVNNAGILYRRQQDLLGKNYVSQQQVDSAHFTLEAAKARLKAARETLRLAKLGPRDEDKQAARATLGAYEAALAIAERDLEEGTLASPADGVIENRILEPGDMASPVKPVFTLALTDPLWLRAYVPEPDLGKLRLGSRAEITTDSYPDRIYRGWVGFISPTAEFTPKSVETREVRTILVYQVRVFVCDPGNELRLGMPASVRIPLSRPPSTVGDDPCREVR